ncbi:unnamed protein product [Nippostrongylus brasiliensis]|uniref:Geranylgeranyl transferase type-2 subunit alpha n=1 Tax=Nippostrongylus brasiliensis TaxID=27835 RepID=A0A158R108_NIPBR|nr:hypothetical protein Q1695_005198 [Nippostrongylus brasiliensis]VDL76509.1 unnamed protein product [Nippostrongylus brasiliensis]
MHFVKKVPTTDEEKAAKEKERAVKLRVFCTVRDQIFAKRAKGELDDEILSLTQKLLEKNPDIYTFWNIRRETIEKKIKAWKDCELTTQDEECKESCRKKIENLLSGELFLTQACLEANHKSYSAWFHRGWALKQQSKPDIKRELALCEKALKLDCRNFHTWDHRRVVAKLGNLGEDEELEFSNRLIAQNFSNYSAWHYRAVLLPRIQNAKTGSFKLSEDVVADELKKVTSAFFTDPDDQSAWVYSRWLLEMGSEKEFLRPDSMHPAVPLSVSFHGSNTTVVMSKACVVEEVLPFVVQNSECTWRGVSSLCTDPVSARIWQCMSELPCAVRPDLDREDQIDVSKQPYVNKDLLRKAFDLTTRSPNLSIKTITENCKQLMEMEPKNMWARYMYTLCLMETCPAEHHSEILENLGKLSNELDVKRKEIYMNLASRQILNRTLREEKDGQPLLERLMDGKTNQLAVRNAHISSLDGVELLASLVTNLDVSGNQLTRVDEILLPNLEYLTANENPIECVPKTTMSLCRLKFLSLGACPLKEVECVAPALKGMSSLERFLYCETPLVEKSQELSKELPNVRLIPYYL